MAKNKKESQTLTVESGSVNNYVINGRISARKLYINLFGKLPSVYNKKGDCLPIMVDFSQINPKLLKKKFPNYEFQLRICKDVALKNTEEYEEMPESDNEDYRISYIQTYMPDEGSVYSYVIMIDQQNNIVIYIDSFYSEMYYDIDNDVDYEKYLEKILDKLPHKPVSEKKEGPRVEVVAFDDGYYTMTVDINEVNIDLKKNYNDDFEEAYNNVINFIGDKFKKSGLVILNGKSGTGKTYFIRHLVNQLNLRYVIIPPNVATHLASPEFVAFLMSMRNSVFILEDCEQVIMERKNNSFSSAVSSILNMTDGIMSDIFNLKFICTFNCDISLIDEAILRKGRCIVNYEFKPLCAEKVQKIMEEDLDIHLDKYEEMTLADIYNYNPNEGNTTKKKIGF